MKRLLALTAMLFLIVGCSNQLEGVPVPIREFSNITEDTPAQNLLNDEFAVTGISDAFMKSTCGLIGTMAKDGYISERELRQLGFAVGTDTKYDWPDDMEKILSIIAVSSRYFCIEYYDMLGN